MPRETTRKQVQEWNPDWSYTDRETNRYHLDRVGARTFYLPPSGQYIGCRAQDHLDEPGRNVMTISPGYIEFPESLAS